jgi:beta-lactamase superfamily II metal-dependent hydrolase
MLVFSGWIKTGRRKIALSVVLICVAVFYAGRWELSRGQTRLTVLPLNGGHAVFVDAAGRQNDWLINSGSKESVQFTLKDFLRARGVNGIPRLVLTEGDSQNCGGTALLDELFGIGELWTSNAQFRSAAYRQAVADSDKPPSNHRIFHYDDSAGSWRVLWPAPTKHFPRADDNALVLSGNFSGTKVLLLSDLGRAGQNELLSTTNDLRADIVIAGLPNEGEPLCNPLLDAIHAKLIIIADSEFPASRRASRELKDRLAQSNVPVIYTRDVGAATIVADNSGWQLETTRGQESILP